MVDGLRRLDCLDLNEKNGSDVVSTTLSKATK